MSEDVANAQAEIARERQAAEQARTELAKALLRLEAMPRLESDLVEVRAMLEKEHQAKVLAEKAAAVFDAQKVGLEQMLEEVKAVAVREQGELMKTVEAARAEIIELKKPRPVAVKKAPVKKVNTGKVVVTKQEKIGKVTVTQAV